MRKTVISQSSLRLEIYRKRKEIFSTLVTHDNFLDTQTVKMNHFRVSPLEFGNGKEYTLDKCIYLQVQGFIGE